MRKTNKYTFVFVVNSYYLACLVNDLFYIKVPPESREVQGSSENF